MRRDARANRDRILAAAEKVFGSRGELGSTEDVAAEAGVGIATVFRHFPTKNALIEATLLRLLERLNERAVELAGEAASGEVIGELIASMIDASSTKVALLSVLGDDGRPPHAVVEATQALESNIRVILTRAKADGAVRNDVSVDDFSILVRGLAQANATTPAAPDTLSRAIEVIRRGLSPSQ